MLVRPESRTVSRASRKRSGQGRCLVVGQKLDQTVPGQAGEKLGGRSSGILRQRLGRPAFDAGKHLGHVVPRRSAGGKRCLAAHQLDYLKAVGGLQVSPLPGIGSPSNVVERIRIFMGHLLKQ